MKEFVIINNIGYLKENNIYEKTEKIKLFINDKIEKDEIISSPIRKKILVGYFSTSQLTTFGKTKSGAKIFLVKSFTANLPNFLISYKGKLKGKIIIRFKYLHWNKKLPTGTIVDVLGIMNQHNLIKTLMFHYNIYPKKIKIIPEEQKINRINYTNLNTCSIDPIGCQDIDDALSLEIKKNKVFVGVHIAQPIYYLNKDTIKKRLETQFSTLYLDKNINLWGDEITKLSSLSLNEIKPAYSIIFEIQDNKIVNITNNPSFVKNKYVLNYESENKLVDQLIFYTSKLTSIKDTHDLVSYWMVKVNTFMGNKYKNSKLPFRINNSDIKCLNDSIENIFKSRDIETSSYSFSENKHKVLGVENYIHFTSPIRRIIDTLNHYYITYQEKIHFNLCELNDLDQRTKRFHRMIELNKKVNNLPDELETIGYFYKLIKDNICEIYTKELGFVRLELYKLKFEYKTIKKEYNKGDSIKIKIIKKKGFLPFEKYFIDINING